MISKKVILCGFFGVGKTSLFNRATEGKFSDKYLTTLGVNVKRKVLAIDDQALTIILWDIAGEVSQEKVPVKYFDGAEGLLYVFDLTRPSTYQSMIKDTEYLQTLCPQAALRVVGNKSDLLTAEALGQVIQELPRPCDVVTSAKSGENVEAVFLLIGRDMLGLNV